MAVLAGAGTSSPKCGTAVSAAPGPRHPLGVQAVGSRVPLEPVGPQTPLVLLCGVFILHPEDPLTFLEENRREIMSKGLDTMIKELCAKELCDFYSRNLMKLYFGFPSLQISLAHCRKFTDKGLPYLQSCKGCHKIICLGIPGCIQVCTDVFKNTANGCNWIQDLLISKMLTLTDRSLVEKCQQVMSVVYLDSPTLSDTTCKALAECKLLKVSIEGNKQNADLSFKLMSKCCPYMRHIHVADCQQITEAGAKIISPLKHILVLNMADCTRYPPKLLYPFSGQDKKIQQSLWVKGLRALGCHGQILELSISQSKNFSDNGIQVKTLPFSWCYLEAPQVHFCKGTESLEHCLVSYCPQLTDEAVKTLAFHCHRLTSVNIGGCPKWIDTHIQYLAAACHYLPSLDISGCIHLTDNLRYLWKGCEQLHILTTLYCRKITKQAPLKYTAELEKQEHNDADHPSWLRYDWDSNIIPSPKHADQSLKKQILQNEIRKKLCSISTVQGFFSRA
ncbi:LOW QUALITY PROTEIN: F-box and leucine-rich repeat protein 13 [Passerculus sandwichensis]